MTTCIICLTLPRDHSGSITREVHPSSTAPAHCWDPQELDPCPETLTTCNKSNSFITHSGFTWSPFIISFTPLENVWLSPALLSLSLCEHWKKNVFTFPDMLGIPVIAVSLSLPWPLQWPFAATLFQTLFLLCCYFLCNFGFIFPALFLLLFSSLLFYAVLYRSLAVVMTRWPFQVSLSGLRAPCRKPHCGL